MERGTLNDDSGARLDMIGGCGRLCKLVLMPCERDKFKEPLPSSVKLCGGCGMS